MTLQLTLPPLLEDRLRREAEQRGETAELIAIQLLEQHLPPPCDDRRAEAAAMIERWLEEDARLSPDEAAENTSVLRALDADRPSYRKLFSDILGNDAE
jgi:hypothetical protein